MTVHFRRSEGIDATEGESKSDGWSGGKPRSQVVSAIQKVRRESAAAGGACRRRGGSAGCWGLSWAYRRGVRVVERAYETGEMGVQGVLRGALRGCSGAGVRVDLGCVQKGFSSCLYASVPSPKIKGVGNLTDDLTAGLTSCLTGYLTAGLTE